MKELERVQFSKAIPFLNDIDFETAYPYSITENCQQGRIFTDDDENPHTVLFWHYCGFGYLAGEAGNSEFNTGLRKLLSGTFEADQKRFMLHTHDIKWDERIADLVKDMDNITFGQRHIFRFDKKQYESHEYTVPETHTVSEINAAILAKLNGRIIPGFSWHTPEAFLKSGKGYCLLNNGNICCDAFSSGIGNKQIDIGVETNEQYRGKGLGTFVAAKMVDYALNKGYVPAWSCDVKNNASARIAEKVGFQRAGVCSVYVKA